VINEINWIRNRGGIKVGRIEHVQGHQDRKQAYHKLTLAAQLNVDADALAREYQTQYGQPRPFVLLFPHAGVNLHLSQGTCTAHIPRALRHAEHERPLSTYIKNRNQWNDITFSFIDWAAHSRAIKKNNNQRIQVTKLIHDLVPTNKIVHRHNLQAQWCNECGTQQVEDRDHVLRCPHPRRAEWRDQFLAAIAVKGVSLRSDPRLIQILTQGTQWWLQGNNEGYDVTAVPVKYQRLVVEQNAIGWRQVFSGRMSGEWARLQSDYTFVQTQRSRDMGHPRSQKYYADAGGTFQHNGTRWTSEIINEIWAQWRIVWTIRNETVHGHDSRTRNEKLRRRNELRLQTIYNGRANMEPSVQDLLFNNIDEHTATCSATAIHNWLAVNETTFIQSVKNATKRAIQGVKSIKSYFIPRRSQPPE